MAVSPGDSITAAAYNTLQGRIENILGTGSGQDGYGQTLSSASVTPPSSPAAGDGATVEAEQMQELWDDMNAAYKHQTGNDLSIRRIVDGDVIGADATGTGLTYDLLGSYTFDSEDTTGGFNDYLIAMSTVEAQRFNIAAAQATVADATTDTRTTTWNGTINMTFTCTFTSADHRRHFFNSGGEIRLEGSLSSGSGAKDTDWATMLSNTSAIRFGYNYTNASSGTGSAIGNYDLTSTYQQIFTKSGSGAYVENLYKVEAKENSTTVIEFKVTLADNDVGDRDLTAGPPPYGALVDEDITGDITFTLGFRRASGSYVSVNQPSFSVTDTFE